MRRKSASQPFSAARLFAVVPLVLTLAACQVPEVRDARQEAEQTAEKIKEIRPQPAAARHGSIRIVERPFTGLSRIDPAEQEQLPAGLAAPNNFTIPLAGILTSAALAKRVHSATGVPLRFVGSAPAEGEAGLAASLFGAVSSDSRLDDDVVWSGPLSGFLDAWCGPLGYEWRFNAQAGQIEVLRRSSVTFQIHALSGGQVYTTRTSAGGQDGEEASTAAVADAITTDTRYDLWPEIEAQLSLLAGPDTQVVVAPSSATVTVMGLPGDVARIRNHLAHLNREVLRPVTVSVQVYSVLFNRSADYNFNLAFALERAFGSALGFSLTSAGGSNAIALVSPDDGAALSDSLDVTIKALNTLGSASRELSATLPTQNGQPTQFFDLFTEAYLRESSTTVDDGVVQTELIPGVIASGFSLSYTPRITGADEVLLRGLARLQDRPQFQVFQSNDTSIQLPQFGNRAVHINQRIRLGETLVITGFSDRNSSSDQSGTFHPDNMIPSGTQNAVLNRTEHVLLLTAHIGEPLGITETEGSRL